MPTTLGSLTKTLILKSESHKLSEEFEVKEKTATLTTSADLIASNSTIVTVNGQSTTATVYDATSHDTTMAAIAVKVAALPGVKSCSAAAKVLTIEMDDQTVYPSCSAVTTGGSSAPTWTAAVDDNTIYPGMPVKLTTDGKIEPLGAGGNLLDNIGYALHQGYGYELVTVVMRAQAILFGEAYAASHTAAPVRFMAYNSTNSRNEYDDASVTHENYVGWSLDAASADGDEIRVAIL